MTIAGVDHYLGPHHSATARREYDRLISEWLARGRMPVLRESADLSTVEALAAYWRYAKGYYRTASGEASSELDGIKSALRFVRQLYADQPASEFGPLALKVVRDRMVAAGLARSTINQHVSRVRRAFKWLASEELIPPSVPHGLATVAGLRIGKTDAREPAPITGVDP